MADGKRAHNESESARKLSSYAAGDDSSNTLMVA